MAFYIINAEIEDKNKEMLVNLDYKNVLDIVQSKIDPDFKIHTLMNKVKRLEDYTQEFDRLMKISSLTLYHKNKIVNLINQRDFQKLKWKLAKYQNMGELNGHLNRYLYTKCINWPNYIQLAYIKQEDENDD